MAKKSDEIDEDIARYRRAAEEALGQIEWCVNYLHREHRNKIAKAIERNVRHIRRQMSNEG